MAQGPVFDPKSTPATNPTPLSMKVENIPPGRSPLPGGILFFLFFWNKTGRRQKDDRRGAKKEKGEHIV